MNLYNETQLRITYSLLSFGIEMYTGTEDSIQIFEEQRRLVAFSNRFRAYVQSIHLRI